MPNFYPATSVTGGILGCLDYIDADLLSDGDGCVVIASDGAYFYRLDASSGETPIDPNIIKPVNESGNKRWILIIFKNSLSVSGELIDNSIIRLDGTDGQSLKSSLVTIDDNGTINIPEGQNYLINNVNPFPLPAEEIPLQESGTGDIGISLKYAREDHIHPPGGLEPATNTPLIEAGLGAIGSSYKYAKEDHIHPAVSNFIPNLFSYTWFYD